MESFHLCLSNVKQRQTIICSRALSGTQPLKMFLCHTTPSTNTKWTKFKREVKLLLLRNCKGSTMNTLYYYNQLKLIERDELADHRIVHSSNPIRPMAIVNVRLAIRCVGPLTRGVVRETH